MKIDNYDLPINPYYFKAEKILLKSKMLKSNQLKILSWFVYAFKVYSFRPFYFSQQRIIKELNITKTTLLNFLPILLDNNLLIVTKKGVFNKVTKKPVNQNLYSLNIENLRMFYKHFLGENMQYFDVSINKYINDYCKTRQKEINSNNFKQYWSDFLTIGLKKELKKIEYEKFLQMKCASYSLKLFTIHINKIVYKSIEKDSFIIFDRIMFIYLFDSVCTIRTE